MLPSLSATSACGPESGNLRRYSLNSPVLGLSRPKRLAICPVYQMDPSGAASGSWGCEPGVGTSHSFMETSILSPGAPAAPGFAFSGAFCQNEADERARAVDEK